MPKVELRGVGKVYPGGVQALEGIELAIVSGEFLAIVGPSGSGKSTLLRLIAGLESASTGSLWIDGRRAEGLAPSGRDVAMVFQNQSPYPHLNVFDNLAFGLRARKVAQPEIQARVEDTARSLGLSGVLDRRPRELSGGERQRVVLGRALARRPAILLLDEPFSNLDPPLRQALRADLLTLHRARGLTTAHVTHDQAEALALGDRVAVIDRGRLVQVGTPADLYQRPDTRFVATFIGCPPMNIVPCVIDLDGDLPRIQVTGSEPHVAVPIDSASASMLRCRGGGRIDLGVRPEHVDLAAGEPAGTTGRLALVGQVERMEPLGHETIVTLAIGPLRIAARVAPGRVVAPGQSLTLTLDLNHAQWFDPTSGVRLIEGVSRP